MLLVTFTGCFGSGQDDDGDQGDDDGNDDQRNGGFINVPVRGMTVTMDEWPQNATFGAEMNFSWSADPGRSASADVSSENGTTSAGANTSQKAAVISETGLAWGFESVMDPGNVTDYNESQVVDENTEAPGQWNGTIALVGTVGENDTALYVRAYVTDDNGTVYWSDEVAVEIDQPAGDVLVVEIGGTTGGFLATYSPSELVIEVGDSVVWLNEDPLGLAHTATSDDGPASFDTGNIAAGEQSEAIVFDTPGTYTYACSNHATMDEATIIVNAPNGTA